MTKPVVRRCPDGHFRRIIYDLGAFIADYPEQVVLAGIVSGWCPKCTAQLGDTDSRGIPRSHDHCDGLQTHFGEDILWDEWGIDDGVIPFTRDFPRADIHELLSSDLLHQVIKGTFKDHLVTWVEEYLQLTHEKSTAAKFMDELDRRLAATPTFPGLRRFKQGRRFKQWTGDDSKALMKVFLPALKGLVPDEIVTAIRWFLDFCYLVRHSVISETTLSAVDNALSEFHVHREFFRDSGVRPDGFSLPRQHSLIHYHDNIVKFGAPNGLCSSITESRHITAVKKPWRRSNRYEAIGQMLLTNQRLDKLAAARADFVSWGMLPPVRSSKPSLEAIEEADEGGPTDDTVPADVDLARTPLLMINLERGYPTEINDLASHIELPAFPNLLASFLRDQLDLAETSELDFDDLSEISVFHSAVARYHAPSDNSGIHGMRTERIRSTPSWRNTGPRRDCAFVVEDEPKPGPQGMSVVRIMLLFSFDYCGVEYPCALVDWFRTVGRSPDEATGMWIVEPHMRRQKRLTTIIHLDSIYCGAHLIPVYGSDFLPVGFKHTWSLDAFEAFYVNKYADYHAYSVAT
ncbi:hypothetical protein BDN72DRAFT_872887 [Pluteus cervinus]|uniref:Uncharacterized protein n=1 Tax=Pluteus cervinus TaxID=181527 RepID=A0ACD3A6Y8_9AGAR|nr:hypothetical protein BDN72DRAFT_872887 [Pluteus cervinus]